MARSPKSADTEVIDRPLSRRILVTVKRDSMTDTPRVVWAHEVPILQTIFGEGEVREADGASLDEGYSKKPSADMLPFNKTQDAILPPSRTLRLGWVFVGNVEAEYARLVNAYGRHVDKPMPNVEDVYGRLSSGKFREIIGRPQLTDCPDDQLRDLILNYGYTLPLETHDSDDSERKAAREAWAKFRALDHDALVALAEQVGVEIG